MRIGQGANRTVYREGDVVKKHTRDRRRKNPENRKEWENWQKMKGTEFEPYFCPVLSYEDDIITMPYCSKVKKGTYVDLPSHLNDVKNPNVGWYDGRIVCIDYSDNPPPDKMKLKTFRV